MERLNRRAADFLWAGASPTQRANRWNTYLVSLCVYPAQVALPGRLQRRALAGAMRSTQGAHGWAPWWAVTGIGCLWGVKGAPRCPGAVADATGLWSLLSQGVGATLPSCGAGKLVEEAHQLREAAIGQR